ncbi:unnamed protein product [Parnassius apollo]|uniref:(apollo) hypothetical protein n=1 Tax=Parnassius apollo TaxID=110799 RepID=A0A8S3WBL5_PARAO|nr:unnamed protein product [Parnassius apollo]
MAKTLNTVWGCCTLQEGYDDDIKYTKCLKAYHLACVSVKALEINLKWICPNCASTIPKRGTIDNTPVRFNPNVTVRSYKRQALLSPPNNNEAHPLTHDDVRAIMNDVLKSHMADFTKEINRSLRGMLDAEMKTIKGDFKEIKKSMEFINGTFEMLQIDHKANQENIKS